MPIHRHMREALNPGQCRPRALQMRVAVRCAHSEGSFTFRTKSHHIVHRDTARIAASRHGAPGCEEACQDIGWNPGDKHKLRQDASCARVPLNGVTGTHFQNRNNRCARLHWNSFSLSCFMTCHWSLSSQPQHEGAAGLDRRSASSSLCPPRPSSCISTSASSKSAPTDLVPRPNPACSTTFARYAAPAPFALPFLNRYPSPGLLGKKLTWERC